MLLRAPKGQGVGRGAFGLESNVNLDGFFGYAG